MTGKNIITVRRAAFADFGAVYQFMTELETRTFDYDEMEIVFRANLLNKNNIYLVAEERTTITGFLSCHLQLLLHHAGWIGEIQELFVKESSRNHGIGKSMLLHLKEILSERNIGQLEVTAQKSREATHQFYKQEGFIMSHQKFVMILPDATDQ